MGLFDFLRGPNINEGLDLFRETPGALLIDVREPNEFKKGHIPGSENVPLSKFTTMIENIVQKKDTPVFLYCASGGRSASAAALIKKLGYESVTNIGGIHSYTGKLSRL